MKQSMMGLGVSFLCSLLATGCAPAAARTGDAAADGCALDGADCGVAPSTPPAGRNDDCATYCRRASALACTATIAEAACTQACEQARALSRGAGECAAAFDAVIRCRAESALSCDPSSGDVVAPACAALEQRAEACAE